MSSPSSFAEESDSEEIFSSSFPAISKIEEEGSESSEGLSDIKHFISSLENINEEDIFNENDLTNININQKDTNKIIAPINIKTATTKEDSKEGLILNEIEEARELLEDVTNLENKIIRSLRYKKRISLSNLNNYLKNKSLKEIKLKNLKEIFGDISPKNTYIINTALELERKKGETALMKLNKLTLEKISHLIGKFKTVENLLKGKNKRMKKNQIKKYEKKEDEKIGDEKKEEKPMDIE